MTTTMMIELIEIEINFNNVIVFIEEERNKIW